MAYADVLGDGLGNDKPFEKRRPGRPVGAKGHPKVTVSAAVKEVSDMFKAHEDWITPLEFLLAEMQDTNNPKHVRIDCAKNAAPYVHRRMPQAIDGGEGKPINLLSTSASLEHLATLDDSELSNLLQLVGKITVPGTFEDGAGTAPDEQDSEVLPEEGTATP